MKNATKDHRPLVQRASKTTTWSQRLETAFLPRPSARWTVVLGVLVVWILAAGVCLAQPNQVALVEEVGQWGVNTDTAGATVSLAKAESGLVVDVTADGGAENFPKAHRAFAEPQDWRGYARLNLRLRVNCADPAVRRKRIALVFYDEKTRLPNLAGNPMKQQSIIHMIPVNRWVEWSEWLTTIERSAIRQVVLYLYEVPPAKPHQYRWEVAKLDLQKYGGESLAFDTLGLGRSEFKGALGKPIGSATTQDGLELSVGSAGELARIALDGNTVGAASAECPSGLLVRDVTKPGPPVMVGGTVELADQEVKQAAQLRDLGLSVNAAYKAHANYTEITGVIADTRGEARAVTVYLALPVAEGPWKWWDSVATARTDAGNSTELAYLETGMAYGLNGCHSKYPLGAVTLPGSAGLTLAIRMDEPVVHRIAYNPRLRLFYVALDFGLLPERRVDGRSLSEASFRILVYRHDAAWGFRSALQRYYEFFPDFFAKRVTKEGGWCVWGNMNKTPGVLEAGLGFHWGPEGAEAVKWDNAHGPLALLYIEPQTYQQTMEDFDHEPSVDDVLTRLDKLVQGDPKELAQVGSQPYRVYPLIPADKSLSELLQITAQAVAKSLNHDIAGEPYSTIAQWAWMSKSKWGAILSCNLAPGIPEGKGQLNLQQILPPLLRNMEGAGARYDGIALDSFGGYGEHAAVNYRQEHFRHSRFPLSFSALDHRPVQLGAFTTVEWVSALAKDMHAKDKVLMANCSWNFTPGWLTFAAPYLDIFGAEAPEFVDPDFIRAIAYRKPCTDLPYTPRPSWEVPRHWLHAIHPGLGNDLKTMQRCVGLLRELVAAGWEPITGARVTPEHVRIERYGAGNHLYLVLHNPAEQPAEVQVQLDQAVLGTGEFAASVQPAGQNANVQNGLFSVSLGAKETVVVVLRRS